MFQAKTPKFRCVIHGSFRKHFSLIQEVYDIFIQAGIEVIAPALSEVSGEKNGFVFLGGQENQDPRLVELTYLQNLKHLGPNGFSYFVDPAGYLGKSTSYELGIAQISNVHCFYLAKPSDHPAYVHKNSVWNPEDLASFIKKNKALPEPQIKRNEALIHKLWQDLMVPGSVVAAGGIIEFESTKRVKEKPILLVKTHKWGDRYSIVGGRLRRNERLEDALLREIKEETGLQAEIGRHITTFDQIKNSGYYNLGLEHIFVDNIASVTSKRVSLNEEAQEFIWVPAKEALAQLYIEPNARRTLELYSTLST